MATECHRLTGTWTDKVVYINIRTVFEYTRLFTGSKPTYPSFLYKCVYLSVCISLNIEVLWTACFYSFLCLVWRVARIKWTKLMRHSVEPPVVIKSDGIFEQVREAA